MANTRRMADMTPEERAIVRAARVAEQQERDAKARVHAAAHPITAEERATLPRIVF